MNQSKKRTELYSRVKGAVRTQNVHVRFAIVTLVRLINLSLGKNNQARAQIIPLQLHLVSLEESLLRNRCAELRHLKDLDCGWHTLIVILLVAFPV